MEGVADQAFFFGAAGVRLNGSGVTSEVTLACLWHYTACKFPTQDLLQSRVLCPKLGERRSKLAEFALGCGTLGMLISSIYSSLTRDGGVNHGFKV